MKKIGLLAVLSLVALIGCSQKELPQEFVSFNPVVKEYLLAGEEGHADAYRKAIELIDNPAEKIKIASYASAKLLENAQISKSTKYAFYCLGVALELEPNQQNKDRIIILSMGMADSYARANDIYFSPLAADFYTVCAKYSSDSEKRKELFVKAANVYQNLAVQANSHREKAGYLLKARNLRVQN